METKTVYPIRSGTYVHNVTQVIVTKSKDGVVRLNLSQGDSIRQGGFEMTIFGLDAGTDNKCRPVEVVFIEEV